MTFKSHVSRFRFERSAIAGFELANAESWQLTLV
jgi:hypothetical protein